MNKEKLKRLLEMHEGKVPYVYADSLGFWTIGVGHLVDKRKGGGLPEQIVDALLDYDIEKHTKGLEQALPWINSLDEVRRTVLYDMAFNLGVEGLLKFKRTLKYIEDGKYSLAANAMLESLWARQVKSRATRLAKMMETGQWPPEVE